MVGSAEPVVACREVVASWCHVSTTVVENHVERKNSTRTPYWTPWDVKVDGTLVENGVLVLEEGGLGVVAAKR